MNARFSFHGQQGSLSPQERRLLHQRPTPEEPPQGSLADEHVAFLDQFIRNVEKSGERAGEHIQKLITLYKNLPDEQKETWLLKANEHLAPAKLGVKLTAKEGALTYAVEDPKALKKHDVPPKTLAQRLKSLPAERSDALKNMIKEYLEDDGKLSAQGKFDEVKILSDRIVRELAEAGATIDAQFLKDLPGNAEDMFRLVDEAGLLSAKEYGDLREEIGRRKGVREGREGENRPEVIEAGTKLQEQSDEIKRMAYQKRKLPASTPERKSLSQKQLALTKQFAADRSKFKELAGYDYGVFAREEELRNRIHKEPIRDEDGTIIGYLNPETGDFIRGQTAAERSREQAEQATKRAREGADARRLARLRGEGRVNAARMLAQEAARSGGREAARFYNELVEDLRQEGLRGDHLSKYIFIDRTGGFVPHDQHLAEMARDEGRGAGAIHGYDETVEAQWKKFHEESEKGSKRPFRGEKYGRHMKRHRLSRGEEKMQEELKEHYAGENLEKIMDWDVSKYEEDPAFKRIEKVFLGKVKRWGVHPEWKYSDTAWMKSQLGALETRAERRRVDKEYREELKKEKEYIEFLGKPVYVRPNSGEYFVPNEHIIIVVPPEVLGPKKDAAFVIGGHETVRGQEKAIHYTPYTENNVLRDGECEALMDAGIVIEEEYPRVGKYPDGRMRVKGLYVHFTKPGRYVIDGEVIHVSKSGAERKEEELKGAAIGHHEVSFGANPPRSLEILDENGKKVSFDLRRLDQGKRLVDRSGRFAVTRLAGKGGGAFRIEFTEGGRYFVTGYENESGIVVFHEPVVPRNEEQREEGQEEQREEGGGDKREHPPSSDARTFANLTEKHLDLPADEVLRVMRTEMEGIDYTRRTATYGMGPFDNPAGELLGILGKDLVKWERAGNLRKTLNITLTPFSQERMDNLLSLLSLANAHYAEEIVRTLQDSAMNLAFPFQPERKTIDLEQDRSSIMIVSNKLLEEPNFKDLPTEARKQKIKQHWNSLKNLQERSFTNSEELDEAGNPKPIDLLIISDRSLASHHRSAKGLLDPLNSHPSQQKEGKPIGKLHEIVIDSSNPVRNLADLLSRYKTIEQQMGKERHLVTFLIIHGNPAGIGFPFQGGSQLVRIDELTRGIDAKKCSLFVVSCYGGEHVRLTVNDPSRRAFIRGLATNVGNTINSLLPSQFEHYRMKEAFQKRDGRFVADINGDGKVTLGEVRYWLDITAKLNDPSSYDSEGHHLTRRVERRDDRVA